MKKLFAFLLVASMLCSLGSATANAAVIDDAFEQTFFAVDYGYVYLAKPTTAGEINNKNLKVINKDGTAVKDDELVTSGMRCDSYGYTKDIVLLCDVDCDGKVTASDARIALRLASYLEKWDAPICRVAANTHSLTDIGGTTAEDARFILRFAAGLEDYSHFDSLKAELLQHHTESEQKANHKRNNVLVTVKKEDADDISWIKDVVGKIYYKDIQHLTSTEYTEIFVLELLTNDDYSHGKVCERLGSDSRVLLTEKNYIYTLIF